MIERQLSEPAFDYVTQEDKTFIIAFTRRMAEMGYPYDGAIVDGICWGRHMLIFRRANVKSRAVVARIYLREDSIALRLFLHNITKHAAFISASPSHIREVFTGTSADCRRCRGEDCKFRKEYEIDGVPFVKCNGETFTFPDPTLARLPDYLRLFRAFYPAK